MKGARFILQSRFFHIAKPGEQLSKYALSGDHVKNLIEYAATRETVDYNIQVDNSSDLSATFRQNQIINELLDTFKDNNKSSKFGELEDFETDSSRTNAMKLISRMAEEILSDNTFDESAFNVAQKAIKTLDFYNTSKRSATQKQIETINSLLNTLNYKKDEDIPFEYDDYISAPTVQNASELISRLSEEVLMRNGFNEVSNLVEYAAKRPGAVKVGEHGLFSSFENVDLEKTKEEISSHEGNIWTHILSLRREDASMLGYDSQTPWRNLIMANIDVIAKAHNIKPENLRWYAAMHNTSHHPHIHLFVYSTDIKEGFFNEKANKSISNLKSEFVTQIFKDERHEIYIDKDKFHKELDYEAKTTLSQLLENPNKYISNDKLNDISNKMLTLSQQFKGSPTYGYQTKEVKLLVNKIQHLLVNNNSKLSDLYTKWCIEKYNLNKFYAKDKLPTIPPIEKNEEFTTIKNIILKQAKAIRNNSQHLMQPAFNDFIDKHTTHNSPTIDELVDNFEEMKKAENKAKEIEITLWGEEYINHYYGFDNINFNNSNTNKNTHKYYTIDELSLLANDLSTRNGEICRKLAECYNYGNGIEKDISQAVMWYGIASDEFQDSIASYKLSQIYLYGADGIEIDTELGNYYCKQAFYLLKNEIKNSKFFDDLESGIDELRYQVNVPKEDAYKEYLIGLMYLKGEGLEQDYSKSYQTFSLSAINGYSHANYYIGNQYYYGLGFNQNYEEALIYYQKASEAKDSYADYRIAKIYLNGEGVNTDILSAEKYFLKAVDKVTLANYDLANLYEKHPDTFKISHNQIYTLYNTVLKELLQEEKYTHDVFTEMRIASMYLEGKGTDINIPEAIKWLEKASAQGNPDAAYQLGYIYASGKYHVQDIPKSNEYYATALTLYDLSEIKNSNSTAEYRIGLIHLNGLGVEKNINKAISWLDEATLNGNPSASYKLAVLYDEGIDVVQNTEKAMLYYQISAEQGNPYAHYRLGNFALERNDIKQAIIHFEQASDENISHAWYKLGQIYSDEKYAMLNTEKSNIYYNKALHQYISDFNENPDDFTAYRIGQMYMNAQGTDINIHETIKWFEKSANLGNADADYQLGYIYKSDEYGFKNDVLSNKYFISALSIYLTTFYNNPTNSDLALRIGTFHQYGLGIEHNIEKAISWYKKAVELGNQKAQQKIEEAEKTQQMSIMSVATTACHFGRMLNTETIAAAKNRYISDSKLLRKEKIQKIHAGQAIDDSGQNYDY